MNSPSRIDQVRDIPLGTILSHLGLTPRREGTTTRYKNDQFNIVVSHNNLWFDNAASVGGRGSIDLALHLKCRANPRRATDGELKEAVAWLTEFQSGTGVSHALAAPEPPPVKELFATQAARFANRDDARWPIARDYLVHTRRLPLKLVEQLHERGDIYASFSMAKPEVTGACFVHRNLEGEIRGATVRAATSRSDFSLSIGEKEGAWFTLGDPLTARHAIVVEAPIDAVSYVAMKRPEQTVVLAMSCSHVLRPVLHAVHDRRWSLMVGFDNDLAGDAGWKRCVENHQYLYPDDPPIYRTLPRAKDWNAELCAAPRRSHGRGL